MSSTNLVRAAVAFLLLHIGLAASARGEEAQRLWHPGFDHAVFAFGGPSGNGDVLEMFNPFTADYEDNFVVGVGYQRFILEWPKDLSIGLEGGVAARFSDSTSAEVWAGPVIRYDGIRLFGRFTLSPAMTGGFSAITNTMTGRETRREARGSGRDATLLFYWGPELNLSLVSHPEVEVFWRLHHRSGAAGTLGDMRGAANVQTLGVRFRF